MHFAASECILHLGGSLVFTRPSKTPVAQQVTALKGFGLDVLAFDAYPYTRTPMFLIQLADT
jgi:hypothetical protein